VNEDNLKPWKKGHSGNPGGVSKSRISFRQALEDAISTEDFTEVVKVLIAEAKKGKSWAIREFFDLTLGKDFHLEIETDSYSRYYSSMADAMAEVIRYKGKNETC